MFMQSRFIGSVLSLFLFTLGSAWAAGGSLEGIVKDVKGKPLKGAEVRIEAKNGNVVAKALSDTNGHYLSSALPAGTYKVDLVVASVIKASINNVQTNATKPAQLNFDLKAEPLMKPSAKGKHFVWMPPTTGTHLGGRWVEVNDDGTNSSDDRTQKYDSKALQRANMGMGGGSGTP